MPALALLAGLLLSAQAPTPDATVQAFIQAMNNRDPATAVKYVRGATTPEALKRRATEGGTWPKFTMSDLTDTITGSRAIVGYKLKVEIYGQATEDHGTLILTQVGGSWLIDAHRSQIVESLLEMFTNTQLYGQTHDAALATSCLSNVKQLCLGTLMYVNDQNDRYKFITTNWAEKIAPYVKNSKAFHCPADTSGKVSYAINKGLVGKKESAIRNPGATVMVYEGKGGRLTYRHGGRAAVGYSDGHAVMINVKGGKLLNWEP
jgi:prepilin-type processing-associated H-X9-DG protein